MEPWSGGTHAYADAQHPYHPLSLVECSKKGDLYATLCSYRAAVGVDASPNFALAWEVLKKPTLIFSSPVKPERLWQGFREFLLGELWSGEGDGEFVSAVSSLIRRSTVDSMGYVHVPSLLTALLNSPKFCDFWEREFRREGAQRLYWTPVKSNTVEVVADVSLGEVISFRHYLALARGGIFRNAEARRRFDEQALADGLGEKALIRVREILREMSMAEGEFQRRHATKAAMFTVEKLLELHELYQEYNLEWAMEIMEWR